MGLPIDELLPSFMNSREEAASEFLTFNHPRQGHCVKVIEATDSGTEEAAINDAHAW